MSPRYGPGNCWLLTQHVGTHSNRKPVWWPEVPHMASWDPRLLCALPEQRPDKMSSFGKGSRAASASFGGMVVFVASAYVCCFLWLPHMAKVEVMFQQTSCEMLPAGSSLFLMCKTSKTVRASAEFRTNKLCTLLRGSCRELPMDAQD